MEDHDDRRASAANGLTLASILRMTKGDIHQLLAEAQYLQRQGDVQAAVIRAREAVMSSPDEETRDEAELAVERYELASRSWSEDVRVRGSEYRVHELLAVGLPAPPLEVVREPRRWAWIERIVHPARTDGASA